MNDTVRKSCPGSCPSCAFGREGGSDGLAEWVSAHDTAAANALRGWGLVGRALGAFVLPTVLAVVGALLAGGGEVRRFAGLTGGLVIGMILGAAVVRLCRADPPALDKEPE